MGVQFHNGNVKPSLHAFMGTTLPGSRPGLGMEAPLGIFGDRAGDDTAVLDAMGEARLFDRDQSLFAEGDAANAVYRVMDGLVRLYKLLPDGRRQIIGFLRGGDMMGLAAGERFAYTAEAVVPSTVRRIPRARVTALMDERPALARTLLAAMTAELMAAQEQMLLLGRKTAREKLATFLLANDERAQDASGRIDLPMSRTDIADYLGLTTETVSREFTKLKTARVIRLMEGGKVELVDRDTLSELAECA
ncbi:helix-turn-helix domain-containing protein [Azospirillum sp. SYSU D00513]|uniref:helix-turn-helix domain-containing protein n=1 Tax=Azospirillum sp. SYSU D00513 TaxID=2812561 RepID=UPI001FFE97B9|nr:helix-turn-helix domain-containing protein [Azospirillum sp. SYSU D00513]